MEKLQQWIDGNCSYALHKAAAEASDHLLSVDIHFTVIPEVPKAALSVVEDPVPAEIEADPDWIDTIR